MCEWGVCTCVERVWCVYVSVGHVCLCGACVVCVVCVYGVCVPVWSMCDVCEWGACVPVWGMCGVCV